MPVCGLPGQFERRAWQRRSDARSPPVSTPSTTVSPVVLSYAQAADYLGLPSVGALRNLVYRRSAPPSIAFGQRDRRFRKADVDAWLEAKARVGQVEEAVVEAQKPVAPRRRGRPTKAEVLARRG